MELSRITALEIFTNPDDLEFTIGQAKEGEKFSFGIFRGPGHRFKPLLTSKPFAEELEDAVKAVEDVLETICKKATEDLGDPSSSAAQHINPKDTRIDQARVLNQGLIERILDELRRNRAASTCKMVAVAE